jgi:hypothetical protein
MTVPPVYQLHELGPQAQMMARNCNYDRLGMIMQCVAAGCIILAAGHAAARLLKDLSRSPGDEHGRYR